jgi:hypothetical protein
MSSDTQQTVVLEEGEEGEEGEESEGAASPVVMLDVIYPHTPEGVAPLQIEYGALHSATDFHESMKKLRHDTNQLVMETSYADMAISSIDGFKNAMKNKMTIELELKRSYSAPRLRWVNAINQVRDDVIVLMLER